MSTAAIMMVKDELDIVEDVIRHLAYHVDRIIVRDNMSEDGTWEKLLELQRQLGEDMLSLDQDTEVGYWQSKKMTALAQVALDQGFSWVVPCDVDECWYVGSDPERRIADWLAGLAPDVHMIRAELYNHIPTASDKNEGGPFKRIVWRKREMAPIGKVACRLHRQLRIAAGNHDASYPGGALTGTGLVIRHFSWRTPEQYIRKMRNGYAAYKETSLPESTGLHWRMWGDASDTEIAEHFMTWFHSRSPTKDDSLIKDPAPYMRAR